MNTVVSRIHLSSLFIYPVKSLRGIEVTTADVDALGLLGDRRFLIVDERGQLLTQRALPSMALIRTELTPDNLILSAPKMGACVVPLRAPAPAVSRTVSVWKSEGLDADDCGDDSAAWLASFLGLSCRLLRIGHRYHRAVLNLRRARTGDEVSFADGYPFLVISEASLSDLNSRIIAGNDAAVPMNRFRPNLVLSGCGAFEEDTWPRFSIASVSFRPAGPCSRCIVTTTDQLTALRGREPLRTLATYRRDPTDPTAVNFGQNLIHETKSGTVSVGDPVHVVQDNAL